MVLHVEPGRLRYNGDRPTAITGVGVAGPPAGDRARALPLGIPTSSSRTRHGFWGLYQNGTEVVVVHPGGAMIGPPTHVAAELDRLLDTRNARTRNTRTRGGRPDAFDRAAATTILGFLAGPDTEDQGVVAAARGWSRPAKGYWLSGPLNQPGHGHQPPSRWPGAPAHQRDPESDEGNGGPGPEARPVSTHSPTTPNPATPPAAVPAVVPAAVSARDPGHREAPRPGRPRAAPARLV